MSPIEQTFYATFKACREFNRPLPFVRSTYTISQAALCTLLKYCHRQRIKFFGDLSKPENLRRYRETCRFISMVEQTAENHYFAILHSHSAIRTGRIYEIIE